jgi:hypothetical protein
MMSIINSLLDNLDDAAAKLGLSPEKAQAFADAAKEKLAAGGDQASALVDAAREHGVSVDGLKNFVGGLGEDAQGVIGKVTSYLDRDGDGNPLNDLGGIVKGFFSRKE